MFVFQSVCAYPACFDESWDFTYAAQRYSGLRNRGSGQTSLNFLSGPNNPPNNFFASQINGSDGNVDTSGTFGSRNANALTSANTQACRQGWDITAVDVSQSLEANQFSAVIRFTSSGDLYVANALTLQINSKGADLKVLKSAAKTFAEISEEIPYNIKITNTGTVPALNVTVTDALPQGLTLTPGSIKVNGTPYPDSFPVVIAEIPAGQSVTVNFSATAGFVPAINPATNIAKVNYEFFPFAGYPAQSFSVSDPVNVFIADKKVKTVKSVDKAFAVVNDVLTYKTVFSSEGNIPLIDLFFTDNIPAGTSFVDGSVKIDDASFPYDPQSGFPLPDLEPGQSVTVEFDVTVD